MHIWAIIFLILSAIGTWFGLLDGKTELESENNSGCLLLLSIILTIIFIAILAS